MRLVAIAFVIFVSSMTACSGGDDDPTRAQRDELIEWCLGLEINPEVCPTEVDRLIKVIEDEPACSVVDIKVALTAYADGLQGYVDSITSGQAEIDSDTGYYEGAPGRTETYLRCLD